MASSPTTSTKSSRPLVLLTQPPNSSSTVYSRSGTWHGLHPLPHLSNASDEGSFSSPHALACCSFLSSKLFARLVTPLPRASLLPMPLLPSSSYSTPLTTLPSHP